MPMDTTNRSLSSSVLRLTPKQDRFVHTEGVTLYRAAIASGKTYAGAVKTLIRRETWPGTVQIIGGPSWDQLRDGTMRTLDRLAPRGWCVYRNDSSHIWRLHNGSELIFRTLDDPDVLRALEAHDLWIDEIALCAPAALDIGLGRLRLPAPDGFAHQAWGTTTPRGMDWTLDVWGETGREGYPVVHADIYDNRANLPDGYIERLEEKYRGTPFFEQELLGLYTAFEGLVYPMFARDKHVRAEPCPLDACGDVVVGVDFGGAMPTAMVLLGERPSGGVHAYDEFYKVGAELGGMMAKLDEWAARAKRSRGRLRVACDGAEQVSIATLRAAGFGAFAANKDRASGLKYVQEMLVGSGGMPRLTFSPELTFTCSEFGQYIWAQKRNAETRVVYRSDTPIDHHADAMDALRYGCVALGQREEYTRVTLPSGRTVLGHRR